MKQKVLILYCWLGNKNDNWYPWLQSKLEKKGYDVEIPILPTMNTNLPDMNKMIKMLVDKKCFDKNTIIVGHSLGSLLAMRLAEKYKLKKLMLVSGWDFDDLLVEHRLFWKNKIDHKTIKKNVKNIICITSDNDPYFTPYHTGEMSKRLNSDFIVMKGLGHFTKETYNVTKIEKLLKLT